MGTLLPSSILGSLGGSSAPEERHGSTWSRACAQHGPAQCEDSGKASGTGLGSQGLVVAEPGLEVSPSRAGRCSFDHCQGSDPASALSSCTKMVRSPKNCKGDCCQCRFQASP